MKVFLLVCVAAWASGKPQFSSVYEIGFPLNNIPIANGPIPDEAKIIGGNDAQPGRYPWQVSLQRRSSTGQWYHYCGGTLVDPTHVVCAAHCVNHVTDTSALSIVVGAHCVKDPTESTQQRRNVNKYIKHEKFSMINNSNDISAITLDSPVEYNERVRNLPIADYTSNDDLEPSGPCSITGWGKSNPTGGSPDALQNANLDIIPHSECALNYFLVANVRKTMVCASDRHGGKGSCNGDSGGPLVCNDSNGKPYLAGVVSFGIQPCGQARFPSVFTKVSSFTHWINSAIDAPVNSVE